METDAEPFSPSTMPRPNLRQLQRWYQSLSTPVQVVLGIGALLIAFGVINAILRFIASLMVIAILGVVLLALYRFFLAKT